MIPIAFDDFQGITAPIKENRVVFKSLKSLLSTLVGIPILGDILGPGLIAWCVFCGCCMYSNVRQMYLDENRDLAWWDEISKQLEANPESNAMAHASIIPQQICTPAMR